MHFGTGSDDMINADFGSYGVATNSGNTWQWRGMNNGAVGGAIVYNQAGEALFFPAAGIRGNTGVLSEQGGTRGSYWSSRFSNATQSLQLNIRNSDGLVQPGNSAATRSFGLSVRCMRDD